MKTTLRLFLCAALVLVTIGALVTCAPGLGSSGETKTGIRFVGSFTPTNSILPQGFPLDCTEWHVKSATGDPSAIDQVFGLGGGSITSIAPGDYHLTVYAQNVNHDHLGEASTTATVTYGAVTNVNLTVSEYSGPGTASGTLTWEPNILPSGMPTFTITLKKTTDSSILTMPFTLDAVACTGSGSLASVPAGWHTAVGVLADVNGRPSTGFAAAVRIASNHNTAMNIALHALPTAGGLTLAFTWNGTGELQITGAPMGDQQIYTGGTIPFTIQSPETGFTVAWYLDGQYLGAGATYTLDAATMTLQDYYRLDAVAISADKQRASSLTWNITKGLYAPNQVRISGTFDGGGWNGTDQFSFTLRTASAPGTVIGTVTVTKSDGNYSFNGVAPGTYCVWGEAKGYPATGTWWNADNQKSMGGTPPASGIITIPQSGSQTFNFPQGFQQ